MISISLMSLIMIFLIFVPFIRYGNYLFWGFLALSYGIVRNNNRIVFCIIFNRLIRLDSLGSWIHLKSSRGIQVRRALKSLTGLTIVWNQLPCWKILVESVKSSFWRWLCNFPWYWSWFSPFQSKLHKSSDWLNDLEMKFHWVSWPIRAQSHTFF